jgi:hypothetical protein
MEARMDAIHRGGCLCGAVTFEVEGPLRDVIACHCSQCRRQTGLYYASTKAPDGALTIRDKGALRWFRSSDLAQRGFCSLCGSALFWKRDGERYTSIMAGSLEQPTGLRIACHIFVGDKGDFYEIEDGRPQHAGER